MVVAWLAGRYSALSSGQAGKAAEACSSSRGCCCPQLPKTQSRKISGVISDAFHTDPSLFCSMKQGSGTDGSSWCVFSWPRGWAGQLTGWGRGGGGWWPECSPAWERVLWVTSIDSRHHGQGCWVSQVLMQERQRLVFPLSQCWDVQVQPVSGWRPIYKEIRQPA